MQIKKQTVASTLAASMMINNHFYSFHLQLVALVLILYMIEVTLCVPLCLLPSLSVVTEKCIEYSKRLKVSNTPHLCGHLVLSFSF